VIALDLVPDLLIPVLPAHLAGQRWAGAHDRPFVSVAFRWHEVIYTDADVSLLWGLVDAVHDDGETAALQLFVGVRAARDLPEFLQGKEREVIGVLGKGRNAVIAYDALVDPDLAIEVLHMVAPDVQVEVRRPLVLEHSNSSVVFDEARILKLFRRVAPGPNPDMEITRVLAAAGSPHVLPPLAELRRDDTDLAVLRDFLVGATEGWELARTSMRDLLASRLPPEESGGDLAHDMERLGAVIAELHVAMAEAWGHEPGDVTAWVAQMQDELARVVSRENAGEHLGGIDTSAVRDEYDRLAGLADVGTQVRIHGDLHLAQVIRVDDGWRVLDFEGEPARRRDDRFTQSSPLRDVAGILRSLHYASATGLVEWGDPDDELVALAGAWERRNREAFLAGYFSVVELAELLPVALEARTQVLRAFELDKAVYELAYELSYRPEQAAIPAAGIARLVNGGVAT
jgi:maltokinase